MSFPPSRQPQARRQRPRPNRGPNAGRVAKKRGFATASYPPLESEGGFIQQLRSNGQIRVGLDENTKDLSARDPQTGELEGFEVDLAHEIAKRLFGDAYTPESVVPVPLVTSEKTDAVRDEEVDITISAVSMSCARWEDVAFSAEYLTADQQFLVRSDSRRSGTRLISTGRTVCVTKQLVVGQHPAQAVPHAHQIEHPRTECLLALQQGEADAYFGHDTFLYGMLEQDPTLVVRDLLDPTVTVSHYGIAYRRTPRLTSSVRQPLPRGHRRRRDVVRAGLPLASTDLFRGSHSRSRAADAGLSAVVK